MLAWSIGDTLFATFILWLLVMWCISKAVLASRKKRGLDSCPTCRKDISVHAKCCPHCGVPLGGRLP